MTNALTRDQVAIIRQAYLAERARRSGSRSFAAFVKQAWPYVMQVDPLVWSWHMDVLCSHLEEVARGGMRKLLINIPPGHAKSVLVSILWPAWIWTWWPKCQFMFGSYSIGIAERDSLRCRAVIESEWYQETYAGPGGWGLRRDQNAKSWFVNTAGGERFSTGVGGTGRRAHIIGIDDPLDTEERFSKAARVHACEWIGTTLSQRFVDAATGRVVMIMQRLHEEDPSAFVLSAPGWEHLMLPSEYDPERAAVTHHVVEHKNGHSEKVVEEFWRDPRTTRGELLFPQKFSAEVLEAFKQRNSLKAAGFATLHQQFPHPEEGGIFPVKMWRFWTSTEGVLKKLGYQQAGFRPRGCADPVEAPTSFLDLETLEEIVISVDPSFRKTNEGSFVAIHVWGKVGARRILLDRIHRRMDFTETVSALMSIIERWPQARRKLIEGKANGDAIVSTLEKQYGVFGLIPVAVTADKVTRAHTAQPYLMGGNIELPEGAPWLDEYIGEHTAFPNGANDDDVDAQSQALQGMEEAMTAWERWSMVSEDELD